MVRPEEDKSAEGGSLAIRVMNVYSEESEMEEKPDQVEMKFHAEVG